jgi:hypothetical protein
MSYGTFESEKQIYLTWVNKKKFIIMTKLFI